MKTYQIIETVYREYFIEAENEENAIGKIEDGQTKPTEEWSDDRVEIVDIHDGIDWKAEPTIQGELSK